MKSNNKTNYFWLKNPSWGPWWPFHLQHTSTHINAHQDINVDNVSKWLLNVSNHGRSKKTTWTFAWPSHVFFPPCNAWFNASQHDVSSKRVPPTGKGSASGTSYGTSHFFSGKPITSPIGTDFPHSMLDNVSLGFAFQAPGKKTSQVSSQFMIWFI